MIWSLLRQSATEWIYSNDCSVKDIIDYIQTKGALRTAQVEALEIYLFLKVKGRNRPLWELITEGFFGLNDDLSKLHISQALHERLETDKALKGLFDLSRQKLSTGRSLFPELEKHIIQSHGEIDALSIIQKLFYDIRYTDYLFSLPMGAGKTYLMAAMMYIDLYFSLNEPENKTFAHNFLVMIPSGLKSSIGPSLKSILNFDPTWVLSEPSASTIKRMMKFEILDESKSAKKSNRARNPNTQKVAAYQPFDTLMGLVLIVNAEKVILDHLDTKNLFHGTDQSDDEKYKLANELRDMIGKIPNLQIHIDEVHHAATDDIKLRQVVGKWNDNGTVNSVLGFSGTPYLSSAETIVVSDTLKLKTTQISNTVFYYPLVSAIQKFLKKPRVEQTRGLTPLQIVERGVTDFMASYAEKIYLNGACAKLAIYCGSIERLEEEIYPHLIGMGIEAGHILKYHKGNTKYKLPKENESEFLSLDTPVSRKKIILLVQVGKEGWDCRSLTGVILSQKGDCPSNMTLQTSCRCLRQMDGGDDSALIWLNDENAKTLDKQLKEEQHTSIAEINSLSKNDHTSLVSRISRMEYLKLPKIDFYQMSIASSTLIEETVPPLKKLQSIEPADATHAVQIITRSLDVQSEQTTRFEEAIRGEEITFKRWLLDIAKESFGKLTITMLKEYASPLSTLFDALTVAQNGTRYTNDIYDLDQVKAKIRLAFYSKQTLRMIEEIIPQSAELLKIERLTPLPESGKLYPPKNECEEILRLDSTDGPVPMPDYEMMKANLIAQGLGSFVPTPEAYTAGMSSAVHKNRTFHYLPYDFTQSGFEQTFLIQSLTLETLKAKNLEIYYNGERALTEFKIVCYEKTAQSWRKVGLYTPDFLILRRENETIKKILIVETKGEGYSASDSFLKRKKFVEEHFVPINNEHYGFKRFDYLYIQDDDPEFLSKVERKLTQFFIEDER